MQLLDHAFPIRSHINTNCTILIAPRNCILLLLLLLVPTPTSTAGPASDKITYFNDRNCLLDAMTDWTYHEETKTKEAVYENTPFNPPSPTLLPPFSSTQQSGKSNQHGHNDSNKLVTPISDQIKNLSLSANTKKITTYFNGNEFKENDCKGIRRCNREILRIKMSLNPRLESRQKYISDKSHS